MSAIKSRPNSYNIEHLWTAQQAAESIGITMQCLSSYRTSMVGPPYVQINGKYYYRPDAVRAYKVQRGKPKPKAKVTAPLADDATFTWKLGPIPEMRMAGNEWPERVAWAGQVSSGGPPANA